MQTTFVVIDALRVKPPCGIQEKMDENVDRLEDDGQMRDNRLWSHWCAINSVMSSQLM